MNSSDSPSLDDIDRENRIYGFKRVGFTLAILLVLNVLLAFLPFGWRLAFYLSLVMYCVLGVWSLRPGPCAVCKTRTMMSVPRTMPYQRPAWWDLRVTPRTRGIHVCPPHMGAFILARVHEQVTAEMLEEIRHQEDLRAKAQEN